MKSAFELESGQVLAWRRRRSLGVGRLNLELWQQEEREQDEEPAAGKRIQAKAALYFFQLNFGEVPSRAFAVRTLRT
jgi:hypothetical protein